MDKIIEIYKIYRELPHKKMEYLRGIDEKFHAELIETAQKKMRKPVKLNVSQALKKLNGEENKRIFEKWKKIFEESNSRFERTIGILRKHLADLSKNYLPTPTNELHLLKRSNVYQFNSQPNSYHYAMAYLQPDKIILELYGFKTEIVENGVKTGFELWGNLTIEDFELLIFPGSGRYLSPKNLAVICWRNLVNPNVIYPFLDRDDEIDLKLARDTQYIITKENMGDE